MAILNPILKSSPIIKRHPANPILSAKDIPYEADCIFNAGFAKYQGKYISVFRNDYGFGKPKYNALFTGTDLGFAESDDGVNWTVRKTPFFTNAQARELNDIERLYDPRLTVIDGELYMCCAVDTTHGICGGIVKIHDLETMEILSISAPDNRNMALFPEKIGGLYTRFERPMPVYAFGRDKFDMWLSQSPDMKFWGNHSIVIDVSNVPYANDKIGPAAPPVKTEKGWLTTFHAVDIDRTRGKNGWEEKWQKRYTAGIMLLDLEDPTKVIGMSKEPLIAPEMPYETEGGFRDHVIFPGGMILEDDGEVKIYYGAADTVECLATANVDDLIKLCTEPK